MQSTILTNLAILALYLLCVAYVFYQMKKDIESRIILYITVDDAAIEEQLIAQELQGIVEISFRFRGQYPLTPVPNLSLSAVNRSDSQWVYLHWADSTLTDFSGRSRRIVRIPPGMTLDLFQSQVFSAIAPGQVAQETLTAEDTLQRNEAGVLAAVAPLFSANALHSAALRSSRSSLQLVLRVGDPGSQEGRFCLLTCDFAVSKLSWRRMMYWTPK